MLRCIHQSDECFSFKHVLPIIHLGWNEQPFITTEVMTILIGNAPCSWGVEFANDERNPAWTTVLDECAEAGYRGIELGPVGFMPEDPDVLGPALESRNLALIGGVVFRAFHDPEKWDDTLDGSVRTCKGKTPGPDGFHLRPSCTHRRTS